MSNPLEVLFGRGAIAMLRNQPTALRRIAATTKPLLMAQVHPDRNFGYGPEEAARISEAYQMLAEADADEVRGYVEAFLRDTRSDERKIELRQLRRLLEGLESKNRNQAHEITELKKALTRGERILQTVSKAAWRFFVSVNGEMSPKPEVRDVRLPLLHFYRVVIEYPDCYRAFEFKRDGTVRRFIKTGDRQVARLAYVDPKESKIDLAPVDRLFHDLIIGSAKSEVSDIGDGLLNGLVRPCLKVGWTPVFAPYVNAGTPFKIQPSDLRGGKIIEIHRLTSLARYLENHRASWQMTRLRLQQVKAKERAKLRRKMKEEGKKKAKTPAKK